MLFSGEQDKMQRNSRLVSYTHFARFCDSSHELIELAEMDAQLLELDR